MRASQPPNAGAGGGFVVGGTVRHERLHQGPPELPEANTAEEKKAKKDKATALQERIKNIAYIPVNARELTDAVKSSLADYLEEKTPETPEPGISQKDLFALQDFNAGPGSGHFYPFCSHFKADGSDADYDEAFVMKLILRYEMQPKNQTQSPKS